MRTIASDLTKDTRLCISLAARPGNTGTRFHNYLYDALGLDFVYKAFTTTDIGQAIAGVRGLGIRGCAVSMPWKEDVLALVDEVSNSADAITSANTIVNTDHHLVAHNTDYTAVEVLLRTSGVPTDRSVAVVGSGGMAKAVVAALHNNGYGDLTVVARNESTGRALAARYGARWVSGADGLLPHTVVNATPIGMTGGEVDDLPVPAETLAETRVYFDVVAHPSQTPFVRLGHARGATVITGGEVLSLQALEQFVLYTGVRPHPDLVSAATAFSRQED
ncbi:MAG: shikimate 5-dehydrogenase [Propioniciclava sp.]